MKAAFDWLMENKEELALAVMTLLAFLEVVVRLTPTKKDDSAMERVGKVVRKVFDFLKIPNVKK